MAGAGQEQWSSKWGFLLAAIGGAVGLGNIYRFPYLTGESGGGAFVLVYLIAVFLIAIPILIGELQIGKRGHKDIVSGARNVAIEAGRSPRWVLIGWLGLGASFFVLTYYSVVAGQVLSYVVSSVTGQLNTDEAGIKAVYDGLKSSPQMMFFWHTLIMGVTTWICMQGISGGIEKAAKIMMPAFFVMLIGMLFYSMAAGDFSAGWSYMFDVDFSKINANTVLVAIGQAFFSIGIGFGYMLAYGAYLPDSISIPKTAVLISMADAGVAIVAGLVIFPLVYAFGQAPEQGPDLIFKILPLTFSQMSGGSFIGSIFFILLTFAALSSCIAILQPAVSYLEESWGFNVKKAALTAGGSVWILGIFSVLSANVWAGYYPLSMFETFSTSTIENIIDYATANYMMLFGGILIAIFSGWLFKDGWAEKEFEGVHPILFKTWLWLARIVAPVAVTIALYTALTA
ncbi:MAG: sodium-dependent transporter [Sphingomonadales bacterium]